MLHPMALEDSDVPVFHLQRHLHRDLPVRDDEQLLYATLHIHHVHRAPEEEVVSSKLKRPPLSL